MRPLAACAVDRTSSAAAAPANIDSFGVAERSFVEAGASRVHINAAISALHSAISTAIGEVVALALADLCNASVVDGQCARAKTLANADIVLRLDAL
jgi:hypothetical protein